MKISAAESIRALADREKREEKILPEVRPRRALDLREGSERQLSPLERGIVVAKRALINVPDVREDLVSELKECIDSGNYKVSSEEVAEMMLRRLSADRLK